jgi:hypothetical protein
MGEKGFIFPGRRSRLKVSSVSRPKKLEGEKGTGTAKLMKPHHELNLGGRIGL